MTASLIRKRWRATSKALADPERPIAADAFAAMELTGHAPRLTIGMLAKLGGALLLVLSLTLAWHFTPLSDLLRPSALEAMMSNLATSPLAPLYVIGGYLLGGLVAFPLVVLIAATAAAFGPVLGFTYALLGSIASAILTYGIGAWVGRKPLRSVLGPRLNRIRNVIARRGILAIAAIRLVPVAPFTIVNLVAGASSIRFVDYVAGTVLGLLPGSAVDVGARLPDLPILIAPTAVDLVLLAGAALIWVAAVFGAQRLAARVGNSGP